MRKDALEEIDLHLQSMEKEALFRGSVLIAKKGEILLSEGYGPANARFKNGPATVFQIGSLTKQFTAAMILELGLDLDAPIHDFISATRHWEGITPRHLLSHTSGIPNYTDWSDYGSITRKLSVQKILKRSEGEDLLFKPGKGFEYSNTGYLVLGVIIEKVTGKSYREALTEKILKPAKMFATGVHDESYVADRQTASGYCLGERGEKLEDDHSENIPATLSDGAMYSTAPDLLKWSQALDGQGSALSKKTIQSMTTPGREGFGFGLEIGKRYGTSVIFHSGTIAGFNADFCKYPDEGITIIVLGNHLDYNAQHVTGEISKWFFGKEKVTVALAFPEHFDYSPYTRVFRSQMDPEAEIELFLNKRGKLFMEDERDVPCFLLSNDRLFCPPFGTEYGLNRDGSLTVYDCFNKKIDLLY
jgi:CubicO group peptidase (beta-lactamase class C family)